MYLLPHLINLGGSGACTAGWHSGLIACCCIPLVESSVLFSSDDCSDSFYSSKEFTYCSGASLPWRDSDPSYWGGRAWMICGVLQRSCHIGGGAVALHFVGHVCLSILDLVVLFKKRGALLISCLLTSLQCLKGSNELPLIQLACVQVGDQEV